MRTTAHEIEFALPLISGEYLDIGDYYSRYLFHSK
jgi:hypothetical protein